MKCLGKTGEHTLFDLGRQAGHQISAHRAHASTAGQGTAQIGRKSGGEYGANLAAHDYVDTLAEIGGLWSFDSGTMQSISNQWAAMPSLHIGWALWCTLALFPVLPNRWSRILVVFYPMTTLFAIIVTGNHYWMDAVGGALTLTVGWYLGNWASRWISPKIEPALELPPDAHNDDDPAKPRSSA